MKKYVLGFLFDPNETFVLLIRKNRPEWQAGWYNGIGGKVEKNETALDAMIREFREETSLEIYDWKHQLTLKREDVYQVDVFATHSDLISNAVSVTDEVVSKVDVNNLPENVLHNLRWMIPLCQDQCVAKPITIFDINGF